MANAAVSNELAGRGSHRAIHAGHHRRARGGLAGSAQLPRGRAAGAQGPGQHRHRRRRRGADGERRTFAGGASPAARAIPWRSIRRDSASPCSALAISRIGFNLARSATIAFAMSQMRRAEAWRGLEQRFRELWEESANLAAVSHAVAKRSRGVNADQALFAGMLHTVGKLFVLTRVSRHPVLLNSPRCITTSSAPGMRAWRARS